MLRRLPAPAHPIGSSLHASLRRARKKANSPLSSSTYTYLPNNPRGAVALADLDRRFNRLLPSTVPYRSVRHAALRAIDECVGAIVEEFALLGANDEEIAGYIAERGAQLAFTVDCPDAHRADAVELLRVLSRDVRSIVSEHLRLRGHRHLQWTTEKYLFSSLRVTFAPPSSHPSPGTEETPKVRVTAQGVRIGGLCAGALPATGELHRIALPDSPLAYFPDAEDYIYRLALEGAWDDTYGSTLDYLGESRSAVELMLDSVKVIDSLIKEVARERNVSTLKKSVKRYLISQEAHIMVWTPRDSVVEVPDEDIETLFTFIAGTLEDICRTCLVIEDRTVGRSIFNLTSRLTAEGLEGVEVDIRVGTHAKWDLPDSQAFFRP